MCVCICTPLDKRKDIYQIEIILNLEWVEVEMPVGWVDRSTPFLFYIIQIKRDGIMIELCFYILKKFYIKMYELNVCIKMLALCHKDENSLKATLKASSLSSNM